MITIVSRQREWTFRRIVFELLFIPMISIEQNIRSVIYQLISVIVREDMSLAIGATIENESFGMTANEISILMGLLLALALTIGAIYFGMRPTLNVLWVRKHGTYIAATVVATETDINLVGRDTGYHLLARWEDPYTHRVYTFRSDPGRALLLKNHPPGSTVEVLIDPRHPERYEMMMQFDEYVYKGYVKTE